MTTALVLAAIAVLITLALDHNHTPRSRLAGSTDVEDRDLARTIADLRVAPPADRGFRVTGARTAATVRPASAIR